VIIVEKKSKKYLASQEKDVSLQPQNVKTRVD
jgi:hypothetical protein